MSAAAWVTVTTEDLQKFMSPAIVGSSTTVGAADEQDPAGNYRSTGVLDAVIERVRGAIVSGGRVALSLTAGTVPPEAKQHVIVLTVFAMSASRPTLAQFVAGEAFKALNEKAEAWLEKVMEGAIVTTPTNPDTGHQGAAWGDMYGEATLDDKSQGKIDVNTDTWATTTYLVEVSASPSVGGTVTGGGTCYPGWTVTVAATANAGYTFTNWTEDGVVVSTDASYAFVPLADRTLVANFTAV